MDLSSVQQLLLAAGGTLTAAGAVYVGIVRPARKVGRWAVDRASEFREAVDGIRDLTSVFARYIAETEQRLFDLETHLVPEHRRHPTSTPRAAIDDAGPLGTELRRVLRHEPGDTAEHRRG